MDWWIFIDLGSSDHIVQAEEQPGPEWEGPYPTFTKARQAAIEQIKFERDEILERLRYWQYSRKAVILDECGYQ